MISCWNKSSQNSIATFIHRILPAIIIWEMWRSRCSSKYDAETPSIQRSKALITFNITQLIGLQFKKITMGNSWEDLCRLYEKTIVETPLLWLLGSNLLYSLLSLIVMDHVSMEIVEEEE